MARIGKLRENYRGEWATSIAYKIDDIVKYRNGFFRCKTDHTSSTDPVTDIGNTGAGIIGRTSASDNWSPHSMVFDASRGSASHIKETGFDAPWQNQSFWNHSTTYYHGDIVLWRDTDTFVKTYRAQVATVSAGTAPSNTASWQMVADSGVGGNLNHCHTKYDNPFGAGQGYLNSEAWNDLAAGTYYDAQKYGLNGNSYWYSGANAMWINPEKGVTALSIDSKPSNGPTVAPFRYNEANIGGSPWEVPLVLNHWMETDRTGDTPTPVQLVQTYSHVAILLSDGTLMMSGYGGHGQLGQGENVTVADGTWVMPGYSNVNRTGETTVFRSSAGVAKNIIKVHCGGPMSTNASTCVAALEKVDANTNKLWTWGYNGYGQLGHGDATNRNVPTEVTWDAAANGKIVDVWTAGGQYGKMFVMTDTGKMFGCGYNGGNQLGTVATGNQNTLSLIKDWSGEGGVRRFVFSYYQYGMSAVVTKNNKLFTWGDNVRGQLGHEDTTDRITPTQVSTHTDVQNVWVGGYNTDNTMFFTRGNSNIDNTLYGVGENAHYQLADGSATDSGATAPEVVRDSFDNALTNIFNGTWSGGGGNTQQWIWQKYHATISGNASDTNRMGCLGAGNDSDNTMAVYESSWYLGPKNDNKGFSGYSATNTVAYNHPNPENTGQTLANEDYRYHQNFRYTNSQNPKRIGVSSHGLITIHHWLTWDLDTGRVYYNGGSNQINYANGPTGTGIADLTTGALEVINADPAFT